MEDEETKLGDILWCSGGLHEAPNSIKFYERHYELIIGIGNDHSAKLIIDEGSLHALCERQDIKIKDVMAVEK